MTCSTIAIVAIRKIADGVLDRRRRADEPFAAADRRRRHDRAGPDHLQQVAHAERRRRRQIADVPRRQQTVAWRKRGVGGMRIVERGRHGRPKDSALRPSLRQPKTAVSRTAVGPDFSRAMHWPNESLALLQFRLQRDASSPDCSDPIAPRRARGALRRSRSGQASTRESPSRATCLPSARGA